MCLVLYIASDVPLRTWAFDASAPAFHVTEISPPDDVVKRHFSKPFVYYAGGYEGCGCAFQCGRNGFDTDEPGLADATEVCRAALMSYLREALSQQTALEIYACWSGDEAHPPEIRKAIAESELAPEFEEREWIVVGDPLHPGRSVAE